MDVLRHVGTRDFYKELIYPTINLQLPILNFNKELPEVPKMMEDESKFEINEIWDYSTSLQFSFSPKFRTLEKLSFIVSIISSKFNQLFLD